MSNVNCCVFGCNSLAKRDKSLHFHCFPQEGSGKVARVNKFNENEYIDIRKAWIMQLKMGKSVTGTMRVCSKHFTALDYLPRREGQKRGILKKNAVPSQQLPVGSHENKTVVVRSTRKRKLSIEEYEKPLTDVHGNDGTDLHIDVEPNIENMDSDLTRSVEDVEIAEALLLLNTTVVHHKISVETQTVKQRRTVLDNIETDDNLNSLTGLHSFKLLQTIETAVDMFFEESRVKRLNLRERIVLTFVKLKLNLSYRVLSLLFDNIANSYCQTVFYETLTILYKVLKPIIHIPSKEETSRNIPLYFQNFRDVRLVFDCTEVLVEKPKCLCCRIRCYSHYKSNNTIKFMVGITPGGLIAFVSKVYGGRSSDKAIFEQSGVLDQLIPNEDAIMVDKGFHIDAICHEKHIKLMRPPFRRQQRQLTALQAEENLVLARARVHIERINQRIKIFKILNQTFPWHLIAKSEEIITICCAIVNLSKPILSKKRF